MTRLTVSSRSLAARATKKSSSLRRALKANRSRMRHSSRTRAALCPRLTKSKMRRRNHRTVAIIWALVRTRTSRRKRKALRPSKSQRHSRSARILRSGRSAKSKCALARPSAVSFRSRGVRTPRLRRRVSTATYSETAIKALAASATG